SNERAGLPTSSLLRSDGSTKASLARYRAAVDTALRCCPPPGPSFSYVPQCLVVEPLIECSHSFFGIRREQVIDSDVGRGYQNFTRFANNSLCELNSSFRLSRLAITVFCDQHQPKARLPSHHLLVRGGCLIEWDGLDHRRHPTQGTETKRCVSS